MPSGKLGEASKRAVSGWLEDDWSRFARLGWIRPVTVQGNLSDEIRQPNPVSTEDKLDASRPLRDSSPSMVTGSGIPAAMAVIIRAVVPEFPQSKTPSGIERPFFAPLTTHDPSPRSIPAPIISKHLPIEAMSSPGTPSKAISVVPSDCAASTSHLIM